MFSLDYQRSAFVAVIRENTGEGDSARAARRGQGQSVTPMQLKTVRKALAGQGKATVAGGIPKGVVGGFLAPGDARLIAHEGGIATKEQGGSAGELQFEGLHHVGGHDFRV